MARAQASKLLDQLLGHNRDGEDKQVLDFMDIAVCRPFLFGICPNEMFLNTKMDMGECLKMHNIAFKAEFEKRSEQEDYGFEEEVLNYLQEIIRDVDQKIKQAKDALEEQEESAEAEQKAQKIHYLAAQIGEKIALAESLGSDGQVEECLKIMQEVEDIKLEKQTVDEEYRGIAPVSSQQAQKLRVCEVCSAYLSLYDNDRRLADHFGGKLHLGFVNVREKMKELEERIEEKRKSGKPKVWPSNRRWREGRYLDNHTRRSPVREARSPLSRASPARRRDSTPREDDRSGREEDSSSRKHRPEHGGNSEERRDRKRRSYSRERHRRDSRDRSHREGSRDRSNRDSRDRSHRDRRDSGDIETGLIEETQGAGPTETQGTGLIGIGETQGTCLIGIGETQGTGLIGIGETQETGLIGIGETQETGLIEETQGTGLIGEGTRETDHPGEILDLVPVRDTGDLVDTLTQGTGHQGGVPETGETQVPVLMRDTRDIVLVLVLTPVKETTVRNRKDTPLALGREMQTILTLMGQTRTNLSNQCELVYNSNIIHYTL
eukprot:TRINITY_DN189_c0_g1_i9.p1 TRINITY_DN189_c0_g1~~TRINITY_DN189_c0_g1_i9.p1  ORF type:complete len:558 (+),score=159.99 TRINITY_DN189_c0_g1_i9:29-1675(+)